MYGRINMRSYVYGRQGGLHAAAMNEIETKTEVVVASGDNAEIRRLSPEKPWQAALCTLEVTSYFEVVLATQAADVAHPAFSNLFCRNQF